jgi:ParB family transcriptional regulator, chromosome partitioning protein
MTDISSILEYDKRIQEINLDDLITNEFNPRARFNEEEEEELIDSILSKGILNPIIVFHDTIEGKYVILDGERRFRACKKINIKKIPARVLVKEPNLLETLSLMFHIHNVREDWTEFAISMTIRRIVDEMGKEISNLTSEDMRELTRMTSLSHYKITKYLKFQDYPDSTIQKFLQYEVHKTDNEQPDPDILLEMHKPIHDMLEIMPSIIDDFSIEQIIDVCIEKKQSGIISNNKEFRLISKSLTAAKNGELSVSVLENQLRKFFELRDYSPEELYHSTSETFYHYQSELKVSKSLFELLSNFELNTLDAPKKNQLEIELGRLLDQIRSLK